jgi:hypothetical protein
LVIPESQSRRSREHHIIIIHGEAVNVKLSSS